MFVAEPFLKRMIELALMISGLRWQYKLLRTFCRNQFAVGTDQLSPWLIEIVLLYDIYAKRLFCESFHQTSAK